MEDSTDKERVNGSLVSGIVIMFILLLHQLRKELNYMFIVNRTVSTLLSFDIFDELDPILLWFVLWDFFRLSYFIF